MGKNGLRKINAWACRHTDRLQHSRGMCKNCYSTSMRKSPTKIRAWKCEHRDRPHHAKGLCEACYCQRETNKRAWKCDHIDQPHAAHGLCQHCYDKHRKAKQKKWRDTKGPDHVRRIYRKSYYKNYYKMTMEQFEELFARQDGKCAGCRYIFRDSNDELICIDHDHACCSNGKKTCGKCVRGILCDLCNRILGQGKDVPETLESLARYLRNWSSLRELEELFI
jgi:hypothetical protein